jgi:Bacterial Ig-like domain
MALFIEVSDNGGNLQRKPLAAGRNRVNAEPGARFRIVDDRGAQLDSTVAVKRVNLKLVVDGLPDEIVVEVDNFFRNCTAEYSCTFSLENFRGAIATEITPLSIPIGALQDGSFVMHAPATLIQAVPVAPEAETAGRGWIYAGAGLLGLAAAGGGGGGKSGGSDATAVSSSSPDTPTLTSAKALNSATPTLTGTGTPGSILTVTLDLGNNGSADLTYTATVAADGRWSVAVGRDTPSVNLLPGNRLPEGASQLLVRATNSAGASAGLLTETLVVDTLAPAIPVINAVTGDNSVSASEAAAGVTLSGRAEAGVVLSVSWLGLTRSVNADAAGTWSVNYTSAQIASAGTQRTVQVTASDAAGNASPVASQLVALPSVPTSNLVINPIAGNDIINRSEATAGVVVTGTTEPGSRVTVVMGTSSRAASVSTAGTYSASFANSELPADGSFAVRASAVNADGSVGAEATRSVSLDRIAPTVSVAAVTGDNVITFAERSAGVTVTGSAESGSTVVVSWGTASRTVSAAGGAYSAGFDAASIPASGVATVSATATDSAGNSASSSVAVVINTIATVYRGSNGNDILLLDGSELANLATPGANINGLGGIDTFSFNGAGLSLNLLNVPATAISSFERVNLTGSGNNTLTLSVTDVLDFASSNVFNSGAGWNGLSSSVAQRQLVVDGNAGDALIATGGWTLQPGVVSNGGQAYVVYTSGTGSNAAMLIIDTDIARALL